MGVHFWRWRDATADANTETMMLTLPLIERSTLPIRPVDWSGLPHEYLNDGELEIIIALIRMVPSPRTVVEIGLAEGRTAKAILRELPFVERYIGIDTDPNYKTKLRGQWTERGPNPGHLALDEPRFDRWLLPRGSLDLCADDFPPVDVVFIDGDHSSEVVRHDSDLARSIVNRDGIIIWHDAQNDAVEVRRVLEADYHQGCDIKHITGTWLAFERR
jgi:predicted O-methyltransferase YrrM